MARTLEQVLAQQKHMATLLEQSVPSPETSDPSAASPPPRPNKATMSNAPTPPGTKRPGTKPAPTFREATARVTTAAKPVTAPRLPVDDLAWTEHDTNLLALPPDDPDDDVLATPRVSPEANQPAPADVRRHKKLLAVPTDDVVLRPKWRQDADAAAGIVSAFDDAPMPLHTIFRSAVVAVQFMLRLQRLALERQQSQQADEARVMASMLDVYSEAIRSWLAKDMRLPILSILQDPTLVLSMRPPATSLKKKFGGLLARKQASAPESLLQLKVRIKGLVDALVKTTEKPIPKAILQFLAKLTCDGAYFPPNYLSPPERTGLEFNALGATRNMATDTRFDLVTIGFVFGRVVVPYVVLQPWTSGIGGRARPPKQVEANLKLVATSLYVLCMRLVPLLPEPGLVLDESERAENETILTHASSLLPKDVLPLSDPAFDAFCATQADRMRAWLEALRRVVATPTTLGSTASTTSLGQDASRGQL
ncbi:hypothetical protein, variant [Saprolegnia diclina VS20]|nr:hypothetical protein, variant [Saprolegnia diclina VS20]EQC36464.1 hypothetical protein, variant [Saprolegnia diclina VS20]|eukprot:XP_008609884.1 hypothetical protein, variant [Saprolegnia diclina VS20]